MVWLKPEQPTKNMGTNCSSSDTEYLAGCMSAAAYVPFPWVPLLGCDLIALFALCDQRSGFVSEASEEELRDVI